MEKRTSITSITVSGFQRAWTVTTPLLLGSSVVSKVVVSVPSLLSDSLPSLSRRLHSS